MIEGRPSETAMRVAAVRAVHQLVDRPLVFRDPLALPILEPGMRAAIIARIRNATPLARWFRSWSPRHQGFRRLRAFVCARSRLVEDTLAGRYADGVRQVVILGAGLDTLGYRSEAQFPGLRCFEVDHTATQAWKRQRLKESGIAIPASLKHVPVDFARDDLHACLGAAGFDFDRPALFSWLGVTMYLTREDTLKTLAVIATGAPGTTVVFDYRGDRSLISLRGRIWIWLGARRVARAGEPWLSSWMPSALIAELRTLGFGATESWDPDRVHREYFAGRADSLRAGSVGRLMVATVAPPSPHEEAS